MLEDGSISCWPQSLADVPSEGQFIAIDMGYNVGCAIDVNGALQCWMAKPYRTYETLMEPPSGVFVDVNVAHEDPLACAIDEDGAVRCWGEIE